jgi:hypothetical protein
VTTSHLQQISLRSFKRFEQFVLNCSAGNILVGPNNAGKSSILDALRILYGARRYAIRLRPKPITGFYGTVLGYEIPDSSLPVSTSNICTNYGEADAEIEFTHSNGCKLRLELHPDRLTRLYLLDPPRNSTTGRAYFSAFPVDVVIVPTLSPFEQEEGYFQDETIERNRTNRLASRYFRNMWYRATDDEFAEFKSLVEATWPNVTISRPTRPRHLHASLEMFYEEKRVAREMSWSGFGFQVWLQILTHALRGSVDSAFILDEPDVYLHPDLQKKLLHIVRGRFGQYFLATHSTEIINEAEAGDIVSINPDRRSGKRVRSDAEYNEVFSYIGSIENVEIAKLARVKKVIFFEGKDKQLLIKFAKRAGVPGKLGESDVLVIGVGGFGQWRRVVEAAWTFKNVLHVDVSMFAVFDRDYRDPREVDETIRGVLSEDIQCAVWNRKEIENYALCGEALVRTIVKRAAERGHLVSTAEALTVLEGLLEEYRYLVQSQLASNTFAYERRSGSQRDHSDIYREAAVSFDKRWRDLAERLKIIPGKQFIADLSAEMQRRWGCSATISMLIEELRADEFDPELSKVLKRIQDFCGDGLE